MLELVAHTSVYTHQTLADTVSNNKCVNDFEQYDAETKAEPDEYLFVCPGAILVGVQRQSWSPLGITIVAWTAIADK